MTFTKKQFGKELKSKLVSGQNQVEIAKWAFQIYIDYGLELQIGLDEYVLKLVSMEEGPEFFLSKNELYSLAENLINE
ncbi:MAG: hypothetical protein KDK56_02870 [Simkania sp.]|nr:hypothetical protein [Simkania sp.]MCB1074569.1 hypothetical protein [Simkania sp.]MCP5491226.1 hypothetical protein [Chlamydiales bacterium]